MFSYVPYDPPLSRKSSSLTETQQNRPETPPKTCCLPATSVATTAQPFSQRPCPPAPKPAPKLLLLD